MKYGLKEEAIEKIIAVFRAQSEVEALILYGSRARGDYRKASDIDLVAKGSQLTTAQLFQLEIILDDLLLPYFIDLHHYRHIESTSLLQEIKLHGVTLYERADLSIQNTDSFTDA